MATSPRPPGDSRRPFLVERGGRPRKPFPWAWVVAMIVVIVLVAIGLAWHFLH